MSPCFAGAKRPLAMVVYDPSAANKRARQEEATTSSSSSADAASSSEPALVVLDVKPINAIPPPAPRLPRRALLPPLAAAEREAPPCLRSHFLQWLGLRDDVPVHFIDDKILTDTDLNPHQNRFRIPRDGVMRRLLPLLTPTEIRQANLLDDNPPRPRPPRNKQQPRNNGADSEGNNGPSSGKKLEKPKAKGKVHGGLRVKLVDLMAGAKELLMSRWRSSRGTVVKGEGYLDFVRRCSFREKDAVEIWAFVQRRVRLFGSDLCHDSLLHVLVVKKDQLPQQCRCCPVVNPSTNLVMA